MASTTKMTATVWPPPPGDGVAVGVAPVGYVGWVVVCCAVVWCAVVCCAVVCCAVVCCAVVCCSVVCCGVVICVVGSVGSPPENLMQATINQQMTAMSN